MYRWEIMQRIAASRVVGIIRSPDPGTAIAAAHTCIQAGLDVIEISLTTPDALQAITDLSRSRPQALVGAGTVLDPTMATAASHAGARFLISPTLDPHVIAAGHRAGAAVIPGAATPTEIISALTSGADAVKLFPARSHTPATLADILQALPHAPIIPTGGITPDTTTAWLRAGAVAVGIGSAVTNAEHVADIAKLLADARSLPRRS